MAYSVELRKHVVARVLEQGLSVGKAAKLFQVGSAAALHYLKQVRAEN